MFGRWQFDFTYEEGTWRDTFAVYQRTHDGFIWHIFERDNTDPSEDWVLALRNKRTEEVTH